jgi:hypothetical protein
MAEEKDVPAADGPAPVDGSPVGGAAGGAWNNGLLASAYVPLTDVSKPMAPRLLSALERARIAAYLAENAGKADALRLYVAAAERADARTIVAAVVRASGDPSEVSDSDVPAAAKDDPLAGIDADAAFAALIADWHVDTHTAIRDAERELTREDEDWRARLRAQEAAAASTEDGSDELTWLDDDHYVPPTPPPLPRPTVAFLCGALLIVASLVLLAFGDMLGLTFQVRLFLAVAGILSATAIFVMRLRAYRDDDDDGAVV